jgi:hypothetical protein
MPLRVTASPRWVLDGNAGHTQLRGQRVFIDLSRGSTAECIRDSKALPMIPLDIESSSGLFAFICVAFAFIRVNSFFPTPHGCDGLGHE